MTTNEKVISKLSGFGWATAWLRKTKKLLRMTNDRFHDIHRGISVMGQRVSLAVYLLLEASGKSFVQALNIIVLVDELCALLKTRAQCLLHVIQVSLWDWVLPKKLRAHATAVSCGKTSGMSAGCKLASVPAYGRKP